MNIKYKNLLMSLILAFFVLLMPGYKKENAVSGIDKIIKQSKISENSTVSVSIRAPLTEKIIYQKDANLLLHPASTLKAFATPVILDVLGNNYKLSTALYKASQNNIYLKLCGDPLLNDDELSKLIFDFKANGFRKIKGKLILDDFAVDDISWGTGWMWDDENNQYMPKFNAYNLNRNIISIKVTPSAQNTKPKVEISPFYPVKIINNAVTSSENNNNIVIERKSWKDPETIYTEGKIFSVTEKQIPVGSPENFFKYRLTNAVKKHKIKFTGSYSKGKVPDDAILISEISRNLSEEIKHTNTQSDNLAAEILFKLAGAKFTGKEGSTENGLKAFNAFYSNLGANTTEIEIADASGVSQNDLITANWMTLALSKLYKNTNFEAYKATLAVPTEPGTLQNRLGELKGKLFAKTGTNAGVSAICGYITDNNEKTYVFSIIIQNFKGTSKPAKALEDELLLQFK